jgi:shikimate dehydrogenase
MHDLYTLTDLGSRQLLDSGYLQPARLAVIGFPIAHSASPRMHQPALDEAGIDARYVKIAIEPGNVAETFRRMRSLGFVGCNVTVPHKLEAMAACDELDPGAVAMGAVNTIRFDPDATRGFNTDGPGFEAAIRESFQTGLRGLTIMIVGAGGGAGGALAAHCASRGVAKLVLANRTVEKIQPLAANLSRLHGLPIECFSLSDPALVAATAECLLLVNASSLGLKPGDASPLDPAGMSAKHLLYDTIYQPPLTEFLRAGARAGARLANGASMLLHQGANAFQIWFPGAEPLAAMRKGLGPTA